jgi:serine/threonine protein kinase
MPINNQQAPDLPPQSVLRQRYRIIKQVGHWGMGTGMGTVYQAIDTLMAGRQVAIKEMNPSALSKEQAAQTLPFFHQEAIILSSLSHPHLPRIHETFSEHERIYLVIDYIEGKTLYELLREGQWQPLPVTQVLQYAFQLCDVLAYLHQQIPPIIFRNIKPTHIMLAQRGQIFLINFHIARFFKDGQQHDTAFLGTRGYAPPEQYGIFQTNPRTDIYGMGATLHFCLTGQSPHHAAGRFAFSPIEQSNSQVPLCLAQLIQRMLAVDEHLRPQNMLEVKQALMGIVSTRGPKYVHDGVSITSLQQEQAPQFQNKTGMLQTIPLQTFMKERADKGVKIFFTNILLLVSGLIFMGVIVAIGLLAPYPLFKIVAFVAIVIAFSHILSMLVRRIRGTKDELYISVTQAMQRIKKISTSLDNGNKDMKHLDLIKQATTVYLQALITRGRKEASRK